MTSEEEQRLFTLYLAKRVKELYREHLVLQMVGGWLRTDGAQEFDNLVADARKSPENAVQIALFDAVIDAKIPPTSEESQDQALAELIQRLGLDQGKIH